jgi:hypothetical protein
VLYLNISVSFISLYKGWASFALTPLETYERGGLVLSVGDCVGYERNQCGARIGASHDQDGADDGQVVV